MNHFRSISQKIKVGGGVQEVLYEEYEKDVCVGAFFQQWNLMVSSDYFDLYFIDDT